MTMDDVQIGEARLRSAMQASYKQQKEAFVSNLTGGSLWEINNVTLVAPVTVLLWSILQSRQSLFDPYTPAAAAIDFMLNCLAILYATTVLSSSTILLNTFIAFLLLMIIPSATSSTKPPQKAKPPKSTSQKPNPSTTASDSKDPFPIKPFVTAYRGTMMIVTCAAILAVDFKVFPRRFAKTENWGTSLMDLGVGSFVFSAGVVAARPILKQRFSHRSQSLLARLKAAARHALPLFVLGLVRLYSVKGLDYAEHVTEYGVHWNFFFTLSAVPPFVALFDWVFGFVPSYSALALILACVYEVALDFTDLKKFILTAPRVDLLSQNREGVFSFFGYLAIFLAGQGAGMFVLPRAEPVPAGQGMLQNTILRKLGLWTAFWVLLFYLTTSYTFGLNLQVSRRLANLPYVLWIAAFNTGQLGLFYTIEMFNFADVQSRNKEDKTSEKERAVFASSRLLQAFNRNGLAVFLLANLLTGLVNLTVPTLAVTDQTAMAVLMLYMAALAAVAFELDRRGISIKL